MSNLFSVPGLEITADDELVVTRIVATNIDPSSIGLDQPVGTLAISTDGNSYVKFGVGLTDWTRNLNTLDTVTSDVPFFKVQLGQTKTIPEDIENGVHFRLTNSGRIFNSGRIVIRC